MELSRSKISQIRSLKNKKFRQKYNIFPVEGHNSAREVFLHAPQLIKSVYATKKYLRSQQILQNYQDKITIISERQYQQISQLKSPPGILLLLEIKEQSLLLSEHHPFTLYLDDISDPGNVGTLIRTASWFDIPQVIFSPLSVDIYNTKLIQATMGAFIRMNTPRLAMADVISQYPNHHIYAADLQGININTLKPKKPSILIVSNESNGLSNHLKQHINEYVHIPSAPNSQTESLNVSIATGIILSHFYNSI